MIITNIFIASKKPAEVAAIVQHDAATDPPTVKTIPEKLLQKIDVAITTEAPPPPTVEIVKVPSAAAVDDVDVIAPAKKLREELEFC